MRKKKSNNQLNILNIIFWVLEIIALGLAICFGAVNTGLNDELLTMISFILWIVGLILCGAAIIIAIVIQVKQKKPLRTFIMIDLIVCTVILAYYIRAQLL